MLIRGKLGRCLVQKAYWWQLRGLGKVVRWGKHTDNRERKSKQMRGIWGKRQIRGIGKVRKKIIRRRRKAYWSEVQESWEGEEERKETVIKEGRKHTDDGWEVKEG